ncbi:hypothetical protein BSZ19_14285 [Bradyrhizobium japonicum]|uniref:Uncharacterized protein n=1 Tax=Bradyrhizobium japonicum TaxID=375 RepID=A0A1Y2JR29_BRAJP|nr:hypothetical protein [Bradyrhizobium japonicum]OSJ33780.1 hypothetical protein BSZ19_14285 [Bradyrhizobium japonicum]
MDEATPNVVVIDNDPEFRDSVARLLRIVGLHARQCLSVPEFLKADVDAGIAPDRARRGSEKGIAALKRRFDTLTPARAKSCAMSWLVA